MFSPRPFAATLSTRALKRRVKRNVISALSAKWEAPLARGHTAALVLGGRARACRTGPGSAAGLMATE